MLTEEGSPYFQEIKRQFERAGYRLTLPRKIIINFLAQTEKYLSAEEIFSALQKETLGIGLATIYRTVLLLEDLKTLSKITLDDGKTRYRLLKNNETIEHQHFLICEYCNKTIRYSDFSELEKSLFKGIEEELTGRFNFHIERHLVEYFGSCAECRERIYENNNSL